MRFDLLSSKSQSKIQNQKKAPAQMMLAGAFFSYEKLKY